MRIFGITFLSLFLMAQSAHATFAFQNQNLAAYNGGYQASNSVTGEGVGTQFLSCGCAEQIIAKSVSKGSACDNYARLHVNAATAGSGITAGAAPAAAASHL
ncbi:MAG: hypothetical protein R3A80_05695 [Bdellovibrionota bacterium]